MTTRAIRDRGRQVLGSAPRNHVAVVWGSLRNRCFDAVAVARRKSSPICRQKPSARSVVRVFIPARTAHTSILPRATSAARRFRNPFQRNPSETIANCFPPRRLKSSSRRVCRQKTRGQSSIRCSISEGRLLEQPALEASVTALA